MLSSFKEAIQHTKSQQKTMVEQLHQLCNINSGTDNLLGLSLMSKALSTAFKPLADAIQKKPLPPLPMITMSGTTKLQEFGDALFISKRPQLKRRILLMGHMDTVYPNTSSFQESVYINDNTLNGPGVADMKGGLIVMLQALTALEQIPASQSLGWDVLINSEEEIGSPASSKLFPDLAPHYQAALVYEPSIDALGTLAKNRSGSGKLTLIATGKSAHVGRAFSEGRNAICYLAQAVTAIHALNGREEGVTINVGKIAGGEALNRVPDKALAQLDIRIKEAKQEFWVKEQLEGIIKTLKHPDYSITVQGSFGRPVKVVDTGTNRLFHRIQNLGKELGLNLDWKDSGGCCDGNNLAQFGLPVIDTLGVRGGNIHSPEEYIVLDSLSERAALSALILIDLAQGGLEDLKK